MKEYGKGFVRKHNGMWHAVVKWKDRGKLGSVSKATGIRCYPDKVDPKTGKVVKADNRGKSNAESYLHKWRDELVFKAQSEMDYSAASQSLLVDYIDTFLAFKQVKPSTMAGYIMTKHKIEDSPLGELLLCDVTTKDIMEWEASMFNEGLTTSTVAHNHAFLNQVLKHAVMVGDLRSNPMALMKAPKIRRQPINSLTRNTMREVFEVLRDRDYDPLGTAGLIALLTGMRRGEVCGLRWLDVDFYHRELHVNHSLTMSGGMALTTPKDPAGGNTTRAIPFSASLEEVLVKRKAVVEEEISGFCSWDDQNFVLGSGITGKPYIPDMLTREWAMLVRIQGWRGTQGRPPIFHDLRHTFATHALANGGDIMAVAAILGHRNPSTTLDIYAVALDESKRSAMDNIANVFL